MKLFSKFNSTGRNVNENCTTADVNPGNGLGLGVTNHLTPVENIVTNLRNLFSVTGFVFSVAEDGFSIKINSSRFINQQEAEKALYEPVYQNQSVYTYITSQGLNALHFVNVGQYVIAYISPSDIQAAAPGLEPSDCEWACEEMLQYNIEEAEMFIRESEDEEEIEKLNLKQMKEIIDAKDKVKAAKQFGILVAQQISLPTDYYFAGVKSKDGDESIALRWKYIKRRPHGKSSEITHSLMNIFGTGDEAVWVGDFDKKTNFQLPDEVKKLIESILDLLGAEKTSDSCIFKIAKDEKSKDDDKKDDKSKDADNDNEDDNSRGDNDDNKEDDKKDNEEENLL